MSGKKTTYKSALFLFFNLYFRPKNGKCDALYLRPRKYPLTDCWFSDSPVGIHQLQQTVARLCRTAGFSGFFTNHSLRATAATRLYAAGLDEQLVAEKTGHRSSAIRSYKRTNNQQLVHVSSVLQGNSTASSPKKIKVLCEQQENSLPPGRRELNIQAADMCFNLKF